MIRSFLIKSQGKSSRLHFGEQSRGGQRCVLEPLFIFHFFLQLFHFSRRSFLLVAPSSSSLFLPRPVLSKSLRIDFDESVSYNFHLLNPLKYLLFQVKKITRLFFKPFLWVLFIILFFTFFHSPRPTFLFLHHLDSLSIHFSLSLMKALPTNGRTNRTGGRTDKVSYRDARTHLKRGWKTVGMEEGLDGKEMM